MWLTWMLRIIAVLGSAGFCLAAIVKFIQVVTLLRSADAGNPGSQLILASLGYQLVVFLACAAALVCIAANIKQVRLRGPDL